MILDLTGRPINVGDRICFTTKTEAPGLRFGVIEKVGQGQPNNASNRFKGREVTVRIRETSHDGATLNKREFDYQPEGKSQWVDTGKPIVVNLRVDETDYEGNDIKDARLWVIQ